VYLSYAPSPALKQNQAKTRNVLQPLSVESVRSTGTTVSNILQSHLRDAFDLNGGIVVVHVADKLLHPVLRDLQASTLQPLGKYDNPEYVSSLQVRQSCT
jgi:hypothetical protein